MLITPARGNKRFVCLSFGRRCQMMFNKHEEKRHREKGLGAAVRRAWESRMRRINKTSRRYRRPAFTLEFDAPLFLRSQCQRGDAIRRNRERVYVWPGRGKHAPIARDADGQTAFLQLSHFVASRTVPTHAQKSLARESRSARSGRRSASRVCVVEIVVIGFARDPAAVGQLLFNGRTD